MSSGITRKLLINTFGTLHPSYLSVAKGGYRISVENGFIFNKVYSLEKALYIDTVQDLKDSYLEITGKELEVKL